MACCEYLMLPKKENALGICLVLHILPESDRHSEALVLPPPLSTHIQQIKWELLFNSTVTNDTSLGYFSLTFVFLHALPLYSLQLWSGNSLGFRAADQDMNAQCLGMTYTNQSVWVSKVILQVYLILAPENVLCICSLAHQVYIICSGSVRICTRVANTGWFYVINTQVGCEWWRSGEARMGYGSVDTLFQTPVSRMVRVPICVKTPTLL